MKTILKTIFDLWISELYLISIFLKKIECQIWNPNFELTVDAEYRLKQVGQRIGRLRGQVVRRYREIQDFQNLPWQPLDLKFLGESTAVYITVIYYFRSNIKNS